MTQRLYAGAFAFGTIAFASACLLLTADPSWAAERSHKVETRAAQTSKSKSAEVVQDPLETSSFANATPEDDASCLTARKKLWVEGEGWIVRRVTTCR